MSKTGHYKVLYTSYEDINVNELPIFNKRILNSALHFINDKKELDDKIYFNYYIEEPIDTECSECGCDIDDDWEYCPKCGASLSFNNTISKSYMSNTRYKDCNFNSISEYIEKLNDDGIYPDDDLFDVSVELVIDYDLYIKCYNYVMEQNKE